MHVSSTTSSVAAQIQPSAPRKTDLESKVEGNKPDGDNDADDKVSVASSAATTAVSGNVGRNINVYA